MIKQSKCLGRWSLLGGLSLAGMFLAGCFLGRGASEDPRFSTVPGLTGPESAPNAVEAVHTTPVTKAPAIGGPNENAFEKTDILQPGQSIIVTFSDLPTVVPAYTDPIKADGTITLLQNQTFVAAGKTRRQLEEEIRATYVPRFYQNMTVSVAPPLNTRFYYVLGDVKIPGRQIYIERTTVLKAITSCGDFTDFAKKSKVRLTRTDGRTFIINCKKAIKNPELDLEVLPGDKVFVPRRIFF